MNEFILPALPPKFDFDTVTHFKAIESIEQGISRT